MRELRSKLAHDQRATDALRALESGNGRFETRRRLCAAKGGAAEGGHSVGKLNYGRNADQRSKSRQGAGLACAAGRALRRRVNIVRFFRSNGSSGGSGFNIRTTHAITMQCCGFRATVLICSRRRTIGNRFAHGGRQLLRCHLQRHHLTRPAAQRRQDDHEDKEQTMHGVMIRYGQKRFPVSAETFTRAGIRLPSERPR